MSLPIPDPAGYGPLGTPNRGREGRIAHADREAARRYREAALRLDRDSQSTYTAELRSLRAETRSIRDQLREVRHELAILRSELPDRISRQLADELPEAHDALHARTEVLRNGTQTRR